MAKTNWLKIVQDWLHDLQPATKRVAKDAQKGQIKVADLLSLVVVYLGLFSLIALLLPGLATTFYGGDSGLSTSDFACFCLKRNILHNYLTVLCVFGVFFSGYSNDWVRCLAVSNIALVGV